MITPTQIVEEFHKCLIDKSRRYMIENYTQTYDLTKRKYVPFKLFPRQVDIINAYSEFDNNITTKPRQAGISTTTAAFIACQLALASKNSPETVLIVANKLSMSKDFLKKIKEFLLGLPRWFWGSAYYGTPEKEALSIFTAESQEKLELINGCLVHAKSSGKSAARGVSAVSWLIFDEAAFIENGLEVFSQAVATTSTGGKIIMISTPNGKDQLYYSTYNKAKKKENNYNVIELKWYEDPRYNSDLTWTKYDDTLGKYVTEKEVEFTAESYRLREKNKWIPSSTWYKTMCGKLNNDPQKIAQELDVSFLGSSDTVVSPEVIEFHEIYNVKEPLFKDNVIKETFIWKKPQSGHRYIMGIDASRGDAEDSSVIEIIDIDGVDEGGNPCIEQVLEYQGKMPGDMLGEIAFLYGKDYNNAYCVVDCIGGTGDACVLTLQRLGYKNLYYDDANLKTPTIMDKYKERNLNIDERLPGFHASSVRFQMIKNFESMLRNNEIKIRSTRVISELGTWIYKNGRPDHMHGYHDDTLTCLAMSLYVLLFSYMKTIKNTQKDSVILKSWVNTSKVKQNYNIEYNNITPQNYNLFNNKTETKKQINPLAWIKRK